MKKSSILLINLFAVILCSGQSGTPTWKKFTEQVVDFELPTKDLRIVGEQEEVSSADSLTYGKFFNDLKIEKKVRYKAAGDKVRCSVMIYFGEVDKDSLKVNSTRFMEIVKEEFNPEIFQIKKEEIKELNKNLRLTLSLISESQAGEINFVTWIGHRFVIVTALEGLESEIEYFHNNFKIKDN